MPAKRRNQVDRMGRLRRRRRIAVGRASARGSGVSRSGGGADSGRYVVRREEGRAGGASYSITHWKKGAGGGDGPRTGIFDFGDPTLGRRVEDEIYRRDS